MAPPAEGKPEGKPAPVNAAEESKEEAKVSEGEMERLVSKCEAFTPVRLNAFLTELAHNYGWKFLIALSVCQHLVKGFTNAFSVSGIDFIMRLYSTTGPQIQTYRAFIVLPWGMKPLLGLASDLFPIYGYRKLPYMAFASLAGLGGMLTVGLMPAPATPRIIIVVGLFCIFFMVAMVDLLSESKYAERLRAFPASGPMLVSFVWGGIVCGDLVATLCTGQIITHLGPQTLYLFTVVPVCLMFPMLYYNMIGDEKMDEGAIQAQREKIKQQPEMLFLTGVILVAVLAIAVTALFSKDVFFNACVAGTVGVIVVLSFLLLTRPLIGKMNAFAVTQTFLAIAIDGATFYFFTDDAKQFPGGPNFSIQFFTTGLGLFVSFANLVGLWSYNRFMKDWTYRSLVLFTNVVLAVLHLFGILIYSRYNLVLGIPDHVFSIGTAAMHSIVFQWMWMPQILLLSQCCPKGSEATMYALLAGCHNVGHSGSQMLGAYVLHWFEVTPRGAVGEAAAFDNLWKVALLACILPMLPIALIPCCIPDAKQTETLLEDDETGGAQTATDGSPWRRFRAWQTGRAEAGPRAQSPLLA